MKNIPKEEISFMTKWFCSLLIVWYINIGLYIYRPDILKMIYWPLHRHEVEIKVIESTIDWQYYINKLDEDLEKGYLYIDETIKEEEKEAIIDTTIIEKPNSIITKIKEYIK